MGTVSTRFYFLYAVKTRNVNIHTNTKRRTWVIRGREEATGGCAIALVILIW